MAIINELIQVGLELKRQNKLESAIEHFRQLHSAYPEHAPIMYELAACWSRFGVPEQALPLYRALIALPKNKSLPPKDMPRLYTRLAATLYDLDNFNEALAILEEGLRLHPTYRPLRTFRIFTLHAAGLTDSALNDSLELMLESLAPSRWDIFEDDIKRIAFDLRETSEEASAYSTGNQTIEASKPEPTLEDQNNKTPQPAPADDSDRKRITVDDTPSASEDFELDVNVVHSEPTSPRKRQRHDRQGLLGAKKVRIHISGKTDDARPAADDDRSAPPAGKLRIPIDTD